MTSQDFAERLSELSQQIDSRLPLLEYVESLATVYSTLVQVVSNRLVDNKGMQTVGTEIHEVLGRNRKIIVGNPYILFRELHEAEQALTSFQASIKSWAHGVGYVRELLIRLRDAHNTYVVQQSTAKAFELVDVGNRLHYGLRDLGSLSRTVLANLNTVSEVPDGYASFTIRFESHPDFKVFSRKLRIVEVVYEELCGLMGVSESEYPLRIRKVETGSFLLSLLGQINVTDLIVLLLTWVGWEVYQFRRAGRIEQVSREISAVTAAAEMVAKLEAMGHDVHELRPYIDKSAHRIVKQLPRLFEDEPSVEINGTKFAFSPEVRDRMLREPRQKLLTTGNSVEDEPSDEQGDSTGDEQKTDA